MKRGFLFLLINFVVISANAETTSGKTVYTISRAPQLSAIAVSRVWTPFVEYLNRNTKYTFELKVYHERVDFERDVVRGDPDFFYGNPGYMVVGKKLHQYEPLVRSAKKQLKGILVARADSKIENVNQLKNKEIVFPGKNAFAASLYIRSLLENDLKLPFRANYVSGHDNVYRAVALGRYVAGGGVVRTLEREPEALKNKLKIIYETPGMAPHPIAAHPRVPVAVKKELLKVVLAMQETEEGKTILAKIKLQKPIKVDYKRDYSSIENISLSMYSSLLH